MKSILMPVCTVSVTTDVIESGIGEQDEIVYASLRDNALGKVMNSSVNLVMIKW